MAVSMAVMLMGSANRCEVSCVRIHDGLPPPPPPLASPLPEKMGVSHKILANAGDAGDCLFHSFSSVLRSNCCCFRSRRVRAVRRGVIVTLCLTVMCLFVGFCRWTMR